jgi:hypothetical protein
MGLNYLRSWEKHEQKPEGVLLDYMLGAAGSIGFVYKSDARKKAAEYAKDFYHSDEAKVLTKRDVETMEKQVAKDLKEFGWKQRLNYHLNGKAAEEMDGMGDKSLMKSMRGIAAVAAATVVAGVMSMHNPQVQNPALITGVGLMLLKGAVLVKGTIDDDPVKTAQYTTLKHAQLALKQLRREFSKAERTQDREEAAKLFAAGYGQPSGGLIQNPIQAAKLKNQGR